MFKKALCVTWMLIVLVSCGGTTPVIGKVKPIIECAIDNDVISLIQHWRTDDLSLAQIFHEAIQKGVQIGGCAYAKYTQDELSPGPGNAAPSPERAAELAKAFEEYRTQHANDASFKIGEAEL